MGRIKRNGQIFTGVFTWILIGMLLIIATATIIGIIYVKSQKNVVYIIDNITIEPNIANASPVIPENITIANASTVNNTNVTNITNITNINVTNIAPIITPINTTLSSLVNATLILSNCSFHLPYPDFGCTPGVIITKDKNIVCTRGYATTERNVSQATKDEIYRMYGVSTHVTGEWQIDHLIPLSLGGGNDIRNLWPEPASPYPGFFQKDKVEKYFYTQVCNNTMDLATAQNEIANNWVAYISTASKTTLTPTDYAEGTGDQVIE